MKYFIIRKRERKFLLYDSLKYFLKNLPQWEIFSFIDLFKTRYLMESASRWAEEEEKVPRWILMSAELLVGLPLEQSQEHPIEFLVFLER